jgi:hypothetical protein
VYGTADDPFRDSRRSLLKRRLGFAWRKLLGMPRDAGKRAEQAPAVQVPMPEEQSAFQAGSGNTLVAIGPPRTR